MIFYNIFTQNRIHKMKNFFPSKKANDPYSYSINTTAAKSDPYAYSINQSNKPDPYAYQVNGSKSQLKNKETAGEKKQKGPPKNLIPQRFALSYNPPTILFEYKNGDTKKLYHHLMKLKKLNKETKVSDALDYLKKKHLSYFQYFDEQQIQKLIQKLKSKLGNNALKPVMQNQAEQQDDQDYDFDYDYEDQQGQQ